MWYEAFYIQEQQVWNLRNYLQLFPGQKQAAELHKENLSPNCTSAKFRRATSLSVLRIQGCSTGFEDEMHGADVDH